MAWKWEQGGYISLGEWNTGHMVQTCIVEGIPKSLLQAWKPADNRVKEAQLLKTLNCNL